MHASHWPPYLTHVKGGGMGREFVRNEKKSPAKLKPEGENEADTLS